MKQKEKCNHNYKLFYFDLEPVIYERMIGLYKEYKWKECLQYKDEYECRNCGEKTIKYRNYEPFK